MNLFFSNPEFIRNSRIQLRPGRVIAAAIICALISITIWASIPDTDTAFTVNGLTGKGAVFAFILNLQVAILLIGGGIYCLQTVHREKDLNSFDFQRVTRLTSFELAIGKLFGAPIGTYFVVLCLLPVALLAAMASNVSATIVIEAYLILVLGAITYHSFALLVSVLVSRGGSALGIGMYLAIILITSSSSLTAYWAIHNVSPFFVGDLLNVNSNGIKELIGRPYWRDTFFGQVVPHVAVLVGLYLTFTAWFLLGTKRNLKRDPLEYEVFSPLQAFGIVLYLSLLMIGFFPWTTIFLRGRVSVGDLSFQRTPAQPFAVEEGLLQASIVLFGMLALLLLRNRERVRLRIRSLGNAATSLWAAVWPTPYLFAGFAAVGVCIVCLIDYYRDAGSDWNRQLALYKVAFLTVWLARDSLYMQWMYMRRAKRPLLSAILYLTVFYGCTGILFSALGFYHTPLRSAVTAILIPSPLYVLNLESWNQQSAVWITALLLQGASALVFVCLHWLKLREFTGAAPKIAPSLAQSA